MAEFRKALRKVSTGEIDEEDECSGCLMPATTEYEGYPCCGNSSCEYFIQCYLGYMESR